MNITLNRLATFLIQIVLLASVIGKILEPNTLVQWFLGFFPQYSAHTSILKAIPFTLVLIEILIVMFLQKYWGLLLNLILSIAFLVVNILIIVFDLSNDCGCFGDLIVFPNSFSKMAFLFLYLAASIYVFYIKRIEIKLKKVSNN